MRKRLLLIPLVLVSGALLSAPATAQTSTTPTTSEDDATGFFGFVRSQGEPVEGVTITVSDGDGDVGSAVTDAEGRWRVTVPEAGAYTVTLDEASLPEGVEAGDDDRIEIEASARPGRFRAANLSIGGSGRAQGRSDWEKGVDLAFDGLKFGGILALASVGLSVIFGVTGLVNFAHGEMLTFGAMVAFYFNGSSGGPRIPLLVGGAIAVVMGGLFGAAQERFLWDPLRRRRTGLIAMLVVSIGLSFLLRHLFLIFFGGQSRPFRDYAVQSVWRWGPISMAPKDVAITTASVALLVVIGVLLLRTRIGTAIRAVADSRDLAEASGIDARRILLVIWVGAGAVTGLAGVFYGISEAIEPDMGFNVLLLIFAAVILGGLGTAFGAMVGGLVVGVATQVSTLWVAVEFKEAVALALLIVFLLVRPQGLLGARERVG